jgi:hypothetical protein
MSARNGATHDRGDKIANVDISLDRSAKDAEAGARQQPDETGLELPQRHLDPMPAELPAIARVAKIQAVLMELLDGARKAHRTSGGGRQDLAAAA